MTDPDVPVLDPDLAAAAEASPVVDPFEALFAALDQPAGAEVVQALERGPRTELAVAVVRSAQEQADATWLGRLRVLRRGLLLSDHRDALAMTLQALGPLATAQGAHDVATDALDTLVGVRELLDQPARAHDATLMLAKAQAAAGEMETAELTLTLSMQRAQRLATLGEPVLAADQTARTLLALGRLLVGDGRRAEGLQWLSGAVDVAVDAGLKAEAEAALGSARG